MSRRLSITGLVLGFFIGWFIYPKLVSRSQACTYPYSYVFNMSNLGPKDDRADDCAKPKGLWIDFVTKTGYNSVEEIRGNLYLSPEWIRIRSPEWSEQKHTYIVNDTYNVYITARDTSPIEPFETTYLNQVVRCEYYTRIKFLVARYGINLSQDEKDQIIDITDTCPMEY